VIAGATALEMTHLGSLYHDDVMDGADVRRGVPSAHAVWGNNVAILTGDLLFSRASQLMAQIGERAIRLQADTFERLVLGQMHETVGPQAGEDPVEFYLQVLADKTGSLIAASAQAGIFSDAPRCTAVRSTARRSAWRSSCSTTSSTCPPTPTRPARSPAPTCARACRPCPPAARAGRRPGLARSRPRSTTVCADRRRRRPAILDDAIAQLRDHAATAETRRQAYEWADAASRRSTRFRPVRARRAGGSHVIVDRSS
jgi:heptaprenyl diphosphate synthase